MNSSLLAQVSYLLLVCAALLSRSCFIHAERSDLPLPLSKVVDLTAENFNDVLEDPANGLFLIKFYAPWCGHCKQLAPVLDEVAPKVAGKMAIGKVDCTTQKALCNEYHVKGYPTIKFYRDGKVYDYPGGRKAHEIIGFAKKMSAPAVTIVETYDAAVAMAKEADPAIAFVLYDKTMAAGGTNLQDQLQSTRMGQVFNQVARKQQAIATFIVLNPPSPPTADDATTTSTTDPQMSIGGVTDLPDTFVVKVEDDVEPVFWTPDAPSSTDLVRFVRENNVNLISELDRSNFHKIGAIGRPLVIGAVDKTKPEQVKAMVDQLTAYAKQRSVLVDQYYFGWMDGHLWKKFLAQFHVHELPQIFVLHVPSKTFYQNSTYGQDVAMFLDAIDSGLITKLDRSTDRGWRGMADDAQMMFFKFMPWSLVALIAFIAIVVILIVPPPEELRPPYPRPPSTTGDDVTQAETEDNDHDINEPETKKDK